MHHNCALGKKIEYVRKIIREIAVKNNRFCFFFSGGWGERMEIILLLLFLFVVFVLGGNWFVVDVVLVIFHGRTRANPD